MYRVAFRPLPLAFLIGLPATAFAADVPADDIVVTGQRPPSVASSGTKSDAPLVETAQSISVISRDDLDVRGVQNLNQALRYTAGISPDTRGVNAELYDQFRLRGFIAQRYLDGLRVFTSPTGYSDQQVDTSRLDRIEVVKGPASVLYGQSGPGGLVAFSSKLPVAGGAYGSVEATYGSFDLYRFDADIGGQIDAGGSMLYRLYGSVNGADTQQSFGKRRRYTISPSVQFGAGGDTSLILLGNYSHDPYNGNYGSAPLYGTVRPNRNGIVPQDFADGDPSLTRIKRNQASGSYFLTRRLGGEGDWTVRANGRYTDVSGDIIAPYQYGVLDATQRVTPRSLYASDERLKSWVLDHQLSGRVRTGAIEHSLLLGVDYQNLRARQFGNSSFPAVAPIDVFAPVYGLAYPALPLDAIRRVRQHQTGLYAQDQLSLGGVRLTGSARYDFVTTRGTSATPFGGSDDRKKDEKFTFRTSALYLTEAGFAPYISYSTSFEPQSQSVDNDGDGTIDGIADPSAGKQIEAGVKYQPPGTPILLTASVFRITQDNIVVSNPITFVGRQSGKVRSDGIELEAKVPLFAGFNVSASYTYNRIRQREDLNPANVGRPLIGSTKGKADLFVDYTVQAGPLQGLNVGGGVRRVGRGYGGFRYEGAALDYVYTPAYTLFDAVVSYDLGRVAGSMEGLKLSVNAANLFNNRHVTSCYIYASGGINFNEWCWYGQRRTVQATIGWRF